MISTRNPYVEKYLVDNEEDFIIVNEVPRMIIRAVERYFGEVIDLDEAVARLSGARSPDR